MHSAGVSEYVSVLTYGFYTGRCTWILILFHPVSTIVDNTMSCVLLDMYTAVHNDSKSNARTQSLRKRGKIKKNQKKNKKTSAVSIHKGIINIDIF